MLHLIAGNTFTRAMKWLEFLARCQDTKVITQLLNKLIYEPYIRRVKRTTHVTNAHKIASRLTKTLLSIHNIKADLSLTLSHLPPPPPTYKIACFFFLFSKCGLSCAAPVAQTCMRVHYV